MFSRILLECDLNAFQAFDKGHRSFQGQQAVIGQKQMRKEEADLPNLIPFHQLEVTFWRIIPARPSSQIRNKKRRQGISLSESPGRIKRNRRSTSYQKAELQGGHTFHSFVDNKSCEKTFFASYILGNDIQPYHRLY